jgi:hypothetical protein
MPLPSANDAVRLPSGVAGVGRRVMADSRRVWPIRAVPG